jgi:hypothetical protein
MNPLKEIVPDRPSRGAGPSNGEDAIFTRFLESLAPDRPWAGDVFAEVWQALRRLLVSELKRRSLWSLPPAYLGIYGSASWADEEALEELTADSFLFVFGERLRSLTAQLCCKPNVEGLVLRSVRNFLHEAQKRHDPVGFRVFTVLRCAVRASVAAGTLHGIAGSPAVRRDTVLAFEPERSSTEAVPLARLDPEVRRWNDDLLPDLITARGWEVPPLLARVEEHLRRLAVQGVAVFRFQDVVDPLRDDVRSRWRALWAGAQGEVGFEHGEEDLSAIVHLVAPISSLEERESFRDLLDCLERGIESLAERSQGKEYLRRLQMFLRNYAADTDGASTGEDERLPSHRRLAELLGIPRERLRGLFGTLQKLAVACRRRGEKESWR